MRTLFVQIFLCFWLAFILWSLIQFMLPKVMTTGPFAGHRGYLREDRQQMLGQTLDLYGRVAPALFEQQGKSGLDPINAGTPGELRTFLFSVDGNTLLTGSDPHKLLREAAMTAAQGGQIQFFIRRDVSVVAKAVTGPSGAGYIAAVEMADLPAWEKTDRWARLSRIYTARFLVMLIIGGVICYVLAWYLTRPIRLLRATAQCLASGDLTARAGLRKKDAKGEMADLGHDLDRMAERIEALVEAQKRLLRDISHELRSPLARLNVALGLVRKVETPAAVVHLNRIENEAERLNELIGQLLTLTIMESGSEVLEKENFDLAAMIGEVVADASFEAEDCGRYVRVGATEPLCASGNRELLRRAVENVVRNAVRYTKEGSSVEIELLKLPEQNMEYAVILVRDHGPGVPEAALTELFRPFYRVAEARDRQSGGTGIGLAIAERALNLHSGMITARNVAGGGLIVEIRVPLV
ncbi:MAG: HAMP domain-containing protein [Desulfuromonadales bacterium]|nr:HAMP domain-containing protein [Desulfuromonadales bacterium]